MTKNPDPLAQAKSIMTAILKLPPKQHSEMKVGKGKAQRLRRQRKKRSA